jgi:hypothetical protein
MAYSPRKGRFDSFHVGIAWPIAASLLHRRPTCGDAFSAEVAVWRSSRMFPPEAGVSGSSTNAAESNQFRNYGFVNRIKKGYLNIIYNMF